MYETVSEAEVPLETPGICRFHECGVPTKESCGLRVGPAQKIGHLGCNHQGYRGVAAQILWNSHFTIFWPGC